MITRRKTSLSCQEADRYLDEQLGQPAAGLPDDLRSHLVECSRCARIHGWMLSDGLGNGISEDFTSRLSQMLGESLKPVKPIPSTWVFAACVVAIVGFLIAVLLGTIGTGGVQNMTLTQLLIVTVVLGSAAILLSVSLSWQIIPGSYQRIPLPLLLGAFGAGFLLVVIAMFPWEKSDQILGTGWGCTRMGLTLAIPVGLLLLLLAMRGAPLCYRKLGACLGATAGLLGLTVLQFSCSNQHAGHLLVWHGAVVLISLAAGYGLGRAAESLAGRRATSRSLHPPA